MTRLKVVAARDAPLSLLMVPSTGAAEIGTAYLLFGRRIPRGIWSRYPLTANGRLHHSVISAITLSVIRLMVSLETVAP